MITSATALAICFFIGAAAAALFTPLTRLLAFRAGALAQPGGRHVHNAPTPTWGGLAIILGFIAAGPIAGNLLVTELPVHHLRGLLIGSGMIAVMGIIDDRYRLPARLKFAVQIAAA